MAARGRVYLISRAGKTPTEGVDHRYWDMVRMLLRNGGSVICSLPLKCTFAYRRTIVRATRNFEGSAWVSYNMSFRRAAANKGSLDWGIPDPGRFNDAFVGRAKTVLRCSFCLSDTHVSDDCPDAPVPKQLTAAVPGHIDQRAGTSVPRPTLVPQQGGRVTGLVEICRLYNHLDGPRCRFAGCRFAHLCDRCHRPHPAAECKERGRSAARSRSPTGQRRWDPKQPH